MYCRNCGREVDDNAEFCMYCGAKLKEDYFVKQNNDNLNKEWLILLLLAIFLGGFGIHRFYVGKIGTGILMLLTFGGCGIWVIIDIILIVTNNFTDKDGKIIRRTIENI